MDSKNKIDPSKINKPIQLLGAWLVGLIVVNGSFLAAAISLDELSWARGLLIIAAVVNVPIFLFAIFLLQTKFRPEMQEDSYYHDYLLSKSGNPKSKLKIPSIVSEADQEPEVINDTGVDWKPYKILINPHLADYLRIKNNLNKLEIPVTGEFGQYLSADLAAPAIMFGRGFKQKNIHLLLKALSGTTVQYVTYGADEDEVDQYNDTILIGPITKQYKSNGIPLSDFVEAVESGILDESQFYSDIIITHNDGYDE
ncbi:hypothetical protein [Rheinheimera sp.]|uniref:hypothetical protein n=1 Tax=Rheinheimera sp. TaxID=1869214 RepID=UPI0027371F73|nr:hypothetical protein [Rheinheimera sp.]MDP2714029.1 hypothetical protein [Rheinheimera sp.]